MRIDIEYIKDLLGVILDHDHPDFRIDIPGIEPLWVNDDEKLKSLVFHMEILEDQNIIESSTTLEGLGFKRVVNGGFSVSLRPLRLTAKGHQFVSDLSKPGVLKQLKTSFNDIGPSEMVKVAFKLGGKALDKKLSELVSSDNDG